MDTNVPGEHARVGTDIQRFRRELNHRAGRRGDQDHLFLADQLPDRHCWTLLGCERPVAPRDSASGVLVSRLLATPTPSTRCLPCALKMPNTEVTGPGRLSGPAPQLTGSSPADAPFREGEAPAEQLPPPRSG